MTTLFDQEQQMTVIANGNGVGTAAALQVQPATNPLAILAAAVQQGANPDQLEKLLALQERYERNEAAKAFAIAMTACQAEMPRVIRDKRNDHTKSMYARLETIEEACRPVYTKHNFSPSYGTEPSSVPGYVRLICDLLHVDGHCRRYAIDLPPDDAGIKGNSNKTPIQAAVSSFSYGKRVLLTMMFNIVIADTDRDGNSSNATITTDQAISIEEHLENPIHNRERFLKWAGVSKVSEIPASLYGNAIAALKNKEAEARK